MQARHCVERKTSIHVDLGGNTTVRVGIGPIVIVESRKTKAGVDGSMARHTPCRQSTEGITRTQGMHDIETPGSKKRHDLGAEPALRSEGAVASRPLNSNDPNPVLAGD
ncbi:MAG: hypothetical protein WD646_13150 [Actinomycetota bacterium]